ncbi:MAG: hypothetical protein SFY96_01500 [Planctomycetota bacterium]|nr:hypothetical protein [Planctomycetota bacterium]
MNPTDTSIVPSIRFVAPGSLLGTAVLRLVLAYPVGLAVVGVACLINHLVDLGGLARIQCGHLAVSQGLWLTFCATLLAVAAAFAVRLDTTIHESLQWLRRESVAGGTWLPPLEAPEDDLRVWPWRWTFLLCLPMGWVALTALVAMDLRRKNEALSRLSSEERTYLLSVARRALYAHGTAIDSVTRSSASGTYLGVLVHDVPYESRSQQIHWVFLSGLGLAIASAVVGAWAVLAAISMSGVWTLLLCVHAVGFPLLWTAAVVRLRVSVAVAWSESHSDRRVTLPPITSEHECGTVPLRDSTVVQYGVRLCDQNVLGWVQPDAWRPNHPDRTVDPQQLPLPMPVLASPSIADGHVYISGKTGSFKTSAAIAKFVADSIVGVPTPCVSAHGQVVRGIDGLPLEDRRPEGPSLILDLKGDLFLKNFTRELCERQGRPFQCLAIEPGAASAHFNPIPYLLDDTEDAVRADSLLVGNGLFHFAGYGASYFFSMNRALTLKALAGQTVTLRDYQSIVERLVQEFDPRLHQGAMEVVAAFQAMASYSLLRPPTDGQPEIRWEEVIAQDGVVYAWLPMSVMACLPRDVMRLMLFTFFSAVRKHNLLNPRSRRKASVFLDEAQVLAGMSCKVLFQQARSSGIRLYLASQNLEDLNSRDDPYLARTIETNTRLRIHFSAATELDRDRAMKLSGEKLTYLISESYSVTNGNYSRSVTLNPRVSTNLNANDMLWLNNSPGLALVELAPDMPTTKLGGKPTLMYMTHVVSGEEYDRLSSIPLPLATPRMRPAPPPTALPAVATPRAIATDRYKMLTALYQQLTGTNVPTTR